VREVAAVVQRSIRQRRSIYVTAAALGLVPLGFALGSHLGTSLFIDRYLLPLNIATALATMELLSLVRWESFGLKGYAASLGRVAAASIFAVFLLDNVFMQLRQHPIQSPDYTERLSSRLPKGIPVLCEDAWSFTELIGREHNSGVLYTYPLDWEQSIRPDAPRLEVTQYHLMENWRKVGYFSGSIEPLNRLLQEHDRFFILSRQITPIDRFGRFIGNPLAERLAHTPGYQVRIYLKADLGHLEDPDVWLVCRGTCNR
jgi:hypothetical protein